MDNSVVCLLHFTWPLVAVITIGIVTVAYLYVCLSKAMCAMEKYYLHKHVSMNCLQLSS